MNILLHTGHRLLNLSSHESPRVFVAWSLVFLARVGFILGGSLLLAIFLSRISVEWLPGLFLANALLMMAGSVFLRPFLHRFRLEVLITLMVLAVAGCLIGSIFFIGTHPLLFFTLFLLAEAALLSQLNIFISLFNEALFTPLESQRTFPVIESAETLGGIVAGVLLTVLGEGLPTYKFIVLWVLTLLLILPLVLRFNPRTMDVPVLLEEEKTPKKLREHIQEFKKIPFIRGLMVAVILFWAVMNMVEYQYTKAIQQDVYGTPEATLVLEQEFLDESSVHLAGETSTVAPEISEEVYQHVLAQKLGMLHLIFNSFALVMQLVFASRILTFLGIGSSMVLHALVTSFSVLSMFLSFNFFTASLSRGAHELTGILFKNAYDASYYAIPHPIRSDVKEFIQGFMKPLGAILGTFGVLILGFAYKNEQETLYINLLLLGLCVIMLFSLFHLGKKYTAMCEQNLSRKSDLPTRLNAIEILGQKGHEHRSASLEKILARKEEPAIITIKILHTLGLQENLEAMESILTLLRDSRMEVRYAAVMALSEFEDLEKKLMSQSFTRYRVLEALKLSLEKESEDSMMEALVRLYYRLDPDALIAWLIEDLRAHRHIQPALIRMLQLFHDPNLVFYLKPYLVYRDPQIRAAAILALWGFSDLRTELHHYLKQMLNSKKKTLLLAAIPTCGEIHEESFRSSLLALRKHASIEIREAALLSLAQMDEDRVIPDLIHALTDPAHIWFHRSTSILSRFSHPFRARVEALLHLRIVERIHDLLRSPLQSEHLQTLYHLYSKVNAHHEAHQVQKLLHS